MTRTELIARLRDSPWHLLRTEYSEVADMLEADGKSLRLALDALNLAASLEEWPVREEYKEAIAALKEVLSG